MSAKSPIRIPVLAVLTSLALLLPPLAACAEVTLTARTSNPLNAVFVRGSDARLELTATGFKPGERLPVTITLENERQERIGDVPAGEALADASGSWTASYPLPTEKYGFYRVLPRLGAYAPRKEGSAPAGVVTYAVVMDPAKRPFVPQDKSFFGAYGGGQVELRSWMGQRHVFSYFLIVPDISKGPHPNMVKSEQTGWHCYGTLNPAYFLQGMYEFCYTNEGRAWLEKTKAKGIPVLRRALLTDPEGQRHFHLG